MKVRDRERKEELMIKKFLYGFVTLVSILAGAHGISAEGRTPLPGEPFPDIILAVPENSAQKEYLGLKGSGSFRISQIKADILVIEIFSMYCPYCQKEAPNVNELYRIISGRDDMRDKIRIIGIGAGNTPFEVDVFRKQYDIEFPLFSDETFSAHTATGNVRTPYFFVIRTRAGEPGVIVFSKVGTLHDPHEFLDLIMKKRP